MPLPSRITLIFAAACVMSCQSTPPDDRRESSPADIDQLMGDWSVSLFYSPRKPPNSTRMVITGTSAGTLTGSFYETPFDSARATAFEGQIIFTATTTGSSGTYIHSGRLVDDVIEGQTFSIGRDFLMAWRAEKK